MWQFRFDLATVCLQLLLLSHSLVTDKWGYTHSGMGMLQALRSSVADRVGGKSVSSCTKPWQAARRGRRALRFDGIRMGEVIKGLLPFVTESHETLGSLTTPEQLVFVVLAGLFQSGEGPSACGSFARADSLKGFACGLLFLGLAGRPAHGCSWYT